MADSTGLVVGSRSGDNGGAEVSNLQKCSSNVSNNAVDVAQQPYRHLGTYYNVEAAQAIVVPPPRPIGESAGKLNLFTFFALS